MSLADFPAVATAASVSTPLQRRFARIVGRDALRWLKPTPLDLHIYYSHEEKYYPDFVVETDAAKYICETKAANEMNDETSC